MDNRLFFPATQRNKKAIAALLSKTLPEIGVTLEIASGSGEHAVFFQKELKGTTWQSSDPNPTFRKSIKSWIKFEGLEKRMPYPLNIDVEERPWNLSSLGNRKINAIVCINMVHISQWKCTKALIEESSKTLQSGSPLILYGPFKINGKHTSKSNKLFDASLKSQDPNWGIRDLEEINNLALVNGFNLPKLFEMPKNNYSLVYNKVGRDI